MVTEIQRDACPIQSPSPGHYHRDGSCRCLNRSVQHADFMIASARRLVDRRVSRGDVNSNTEMIAALVEILDSFREALVLYASDAEVRRAALRVLVATGAEGPVQIPPNERGEFPEDKTLGDRKARLRRAMRGET